MCTALSLVFVCIVPLYSQLAGHDIRTEGVNVVKYDAVFQSLGDGGAVDQFGEGKRGSGLGRRKGKGNDGDCRHVEFVSTTWSSDKR